MTREEYNSIVIEVMAIMKTGAIVKYDGDEVEAAGLNSDKGGKPYLFIFGFGEEMTYDEFVEHVNHNFTEFKSRFTNSTPMFP